MSAIVGKKLGMTRVFDEDGIAVPVTVIEAEPNVITALRTSERAGSDAVQLAGVPTEERKLTKPELGHLKKADAGAMRKRGARTRATDATLHSRWEGRFARES